MSPYDKMSSRGLPQVAPAPTATPMKAPTPSLRNIMNAQQPVANGPVPSGSRMPQVSPPKSPAAPPQQSLGGFDPRALMASGLDPRAVSQQGKDAFESFLKGAQNQESAHPGSTFLGQHGQNQQSAPPQSSLGGFNPQALQGLQSQMSGNSNIMPYGQPGQNQNSLGGFNPQSLQGLQSQMSGQHGQNQNTPNPYGGLAGLASGMGQLPMNPMQPMGGQQSLGMQQPMGGMYGPAPMGGMNPMSPMGNSLQTPAASPMGGGPMGASPMGAGSTGGGFGIKS